METGLPNILKITVIEFAFIWLYNDVDDSENGKIKCYLIDSKIEYGKYDVGGSYRIVEKIENPEYVCIKIVIDFHNKSSRLIGVRDTK